MACRFMPALDSLLQQADLLSLLQARQEVA
jgi:hypothetical protein